MRSYLRDAVNTSKGRRFFGTSPSRMPINPVQHKTRFDWLSLVRYQSLIMEHSLTYLFLRILACAQHAGKPTVAVEHARKIILGHQFNNEPLRILLASLGGGLRATDAFLASTLSKHLLREVRLTDTAVKNKDGLKWNATLKRWGPSSAKAEPDDDDDLEPDDPQEESSAHPTIDKTTNLESLPTKGNPVNIAVYGQICLAAKSYQSALCTS